MVKINKYINNNNSYYSNMKKIIMAVFLLCLSIMSVSAIEQSELLQYRFEENGGSIILDTSGYDNHASINGGGWSIINKFGNYAFEFDGANDWIETISQRDIPETISISWWGNTNTNAKTTMFSIYDTSDLIEFSFDTNSFVDFSYLDTNGSLQTIILDTNTYTVDAYYHLVLTIDSTTNTYKYYVDNQLRSNGNLTNPISRIAVNNVLRVGTDSIGSNDYSGLIDEFRIFDFILSDSQVNELYSTNLITLIIDEPVINETVGIVIINSTTPINNQIVTTSEKISVLLNYKSSCDLYIDNNLINSYSDVLGFNYELLSFLDGNYKYFVYCEYIEGTTKYFEMTEVINFEVSKPSKTIEFFIYDEEKNLANNEDLFLITPCATKQEFGEHWIIDDGDEYYIQNLINGMASFNLTYDGDYEFCLMKGKVNYKDDEFSMDYDFVDVNKQTELGKLFVGTQTLTYSLTVTDIDLFSATDPAFWGKTWSALFELIVGIILGAFVMLLGVTFNNDKLVMVGGLIIAIGMGVSFSTFVGVVI